MEALLAAEVEEEVTDGFNQVGRVFLTDGGGSVLDVAIQVVR